MAAKKPTRVPGAPGALRESAESLSERRQLLDQQPMAQARLRQHAAALRTYILTHHACALFAAALGTSDDFHLRPVSMQGLKIEQYRGK